MRRSITVPFVLSLMISAAHATSTDLNCHLMVKFTDLAKQNRCYDHARNNKQFDSCTNVGVKLLKTESFDISTEPDSDVVKKEVPLPISAGDLSEDNHLVANIEFVAGRDQDKGSGVFPAGTPLTYVTASTGALRQNHLYCIIVGNGTGCMGVASRHVYPGRTSKIKGSYGFRMSLECAKKE